MSTKIKITGNTYPAKELLRSLGCRWDAADKCWWTDSEEIAIKAQAAVAPHPMYNSPPPQDLGTVEPVTSAAKYGRTAVAGATVKSFTVTGLERGDDGKPNGSIRVVRGVRYVQVDRTVRRYLSRDYLEDMDMFSSRPGGSYQWDGVAIESTPDEIAKESVAQEAKEAPLRAGVALEAMLQTLDKCEVAPAWIDAAHRIARWTNPVMIHTGAYPALYRYGETVCYHVPGYFACDWEHDSETRIGTCPAALLAPLLEAGWKHGILEPQTA